MNRIIQKSNIEYRISKIGFRVGLAGLCCLLLSLVACGEVSPAATPTNTPQVNFPTLAPRPTKPSFSPVPTITPSPGGRNGTTTPAVKLPTPTLTPRPTQPPNTTGSLASLPWQAYRAGTKRPNLAEHEKAMLPAFKSDLNLPQLQNAPIYNIAVMVDPDNTQATASEQLFYTNDTGQTLDSLYLWLWANAPTEVGYQPPLTVANIRLNGKSATWTLANNGAQLKINLGQLAPNAQAVIELDFSLKIPPAGRYEYFKYDAASQILSLTFWYPQLAIYDPAYGGWDTHEFNQQGDITNSRTSFFNLWLTVPTEQIPVINGKILDYKANPDDSRTYRVATGPVRDLVATLSPNYQTIDTKVGDTTVVSYFLERDRVAGEKAAQIAANAIQSYNDLFGVYPYSEFKIAEAPLVSFGGFEFPTMTLITNRYYTDTNAFALEYALAHEIAHQWWYGLVGSDQILRAWQDESLSQFSPILYYERFKGKAEGQRILNAYMQSSFRAALDAGRDDIVDQSVYAWKDFNGYVWSVYNKGGMFYNAYRAKFGDTAFIRFAKNYYDNNRYKFAGENDILEALKAGTGPGQEDEVVELFRHWFRAREGDKDR